MGRKRLKIKTKLNYRRGSTAHYCGECNNYVPDFQVMGIGGIPLKKAPRCKIIGLENSVLYQVNYNAICDAHDNSNVLKRLKGQKSRKE